MDIHEAKVKDFELKRKMKVTVVPTDDVKVRQMLRQLGEPITIFGEKEVCMFTGCVLFMRHASPPVMVSGRFAWHGDGLLAGKPPLICFWLMPV